ncbi:MAG: 50S ribosomal protein L9 [Proteobacteria bacterium]|nr:50S ribosomal protein L9 [Pseudomonadota bacterium]
MKIILTEDVVGLGDIGETVNVKPGFARNFLIPKGVARECQSLSAKQLAHWMKQIESKKKRLKAVAESKASEISSKSITLELKTGAHGKVFGSIHAKDIAIKLTEIGIEIDRRRVVLVEPIKKIGEHKVKVRLHQEVETEITVIVKAIEPSKEDIEKEVVKTKKAFSKEVEELDEDNTQIQ